MEDFFGPKDCEVSVLSEGEPLPWRKKHQQVIAYLTPEGTAHVLKKPRWNLEVEPQAFLDVFCADNPGWRSTTSTATMCCAISPPGRLPWDSACL
jgi:hypothetical protein